MKMKPEWQATLTEPHIVTLFDNATIVADPANTRLATQYQWTLMATVTPSAVAFHNGNFHVCNIDALMLDLCINGGQPKMGQTGDVFVFAYQFKGYKNTAWNLERRLLQMPEFENVTLYMGHQF